MNTHLHFMLVLSICALLAVAPAVNGQDLPPPSSIAQSQNEYPNDVSSEVVTVRIMDHSSGHREHFVKFAQCQIDIELESDGRGLWRAPKGKEGDLRSRIDRCVSQARADHVEVLILPELALALSPPHFSDAISSLRKTASDARMIIVAGSYYDPDRNSRLVVIGPGWQELGYKIRPSRMESCPRNSMGMNSKSELLVIRSDYGTFAVITCVDLISDEVQSKIRELANDGIIDVIININDNPAAWEFLIEANSIVRRHPVFASITNVGMPAGSADPHDDKGNPVDHGYSYGNSAIFADLRDASNDYPDNSAEMIADLPDYFLELWGKDPHTGKEIKSRRISYDHLVAVVPAYQEGLLEYDLNLRLKREPMSTNAPDQGYPPIRNVRRIRFKTLPVGPESTEQTRLRFD